MLKRFAFIAAVSALLLSACAGEMTPVPTLTPTPGGENTEPNVSSPSEHEMWNHYPVGTMSDLIAYGDAFIAENPAEMFTAAGEENGPYTFDAGLSDASLIRAQVRYTGECRPISDEHLLAMTWWIGTNKPELRELFLETFKQECRFTELEGDTEYWLPTQEVIIEDQAAGLLEGQEITIYVQYLGSIVPEAGDHEHLYFVNYYWVEPTS